MGKAPLSQCINCGGPETIKAHIIPRSFAHEARGGGKHLAAVTWDNSGTSQSGSWDAKILCKQCDEKLNVYDHHAIRFCRAHDSYPFNDGRVCKLHTDGSRLAGFVNAVLWRASITKRPDFSVDLGAHQNSVRDALLRNGPAYMLLPVFVFPYIMGKIPRLGMYTHPTPHQLSKHSAASAYSFSLGGFRFTGVINPELIPKNFHALIINGKSPAYVSPVPISETTEFDAIVDLFVSHMRRKGGRF